MEHIHLIPPHSPLADVAQMIWQLDRRQVAFNRETIIPKGTIEIIFNLNTTEAVQAQIGTRTYQLPRCFINGFNSFPVELLLPSTHLLFGLVLNATAVKTIFGIEAEDFSNQCVDMALVHPEIDRIWHQLAEQPVFETRVATMSNWLLNKLPSLSAQDRFFDQYLRNPAPEALTVAKLADLLCYSPRHLTRKLQHLVGMNTEQTILYKKYLQSMTLMHHSDMSLTEIAHRCQFSDQSHFSKVFRSFSQLTPREYQGLKSHLPGHIYSNVR